MLSRPFYHNSISRPGSRRFGHSLFRVVVRQKRLVIKRLGLSARLNRVVEPLILAEVVARTLEHDGRLPPAALRPPYHADHAAFVVAPAGVRAQHLDAGAVDVVQPQRAIAVQRSHAAAAFDLARAEVYGLDDALAAAVAAAQPRGARPDVLCRRDDGQLAEALSGEVEASRAMLSHLDARFKRRLGELTWYRLR